MTHLVCPDCRHENEVERIYCHNCGGRLDRSALRKEKGIDDEKDADDTQKHLGRMFDPQRGRTRALVRKFFSILAGAFALAVVIQLLLPPDLPAQVKSDSMAPMINMDLLSALENRTPPRLTYSQEQVNSYISGLLRRANSPAKEGFFPMRRLFVQLNEGTCRVNAGYSFFGLPLFTGGVYEVTLGQGKIVTNCRGGYCGRMPIHPALMSQLGFLLHKVSATLDREQKQLARLNGIEFHPESVNLIVAPQG